ncbi:protein arginine N-methyltransferase 5 isoform X2 [Venturia canescens]|nr:protein arginine N-methyltransferase 5 isoform X2 [Venturia canescens]XP_043285901.1 protein arginine N-methyltransferase 5 isoform X2 [Venturia canescens]
MENSRRPVSCGLDFCSAPDLNNCIIEAKSMKFDFICVPLVHPLFKQEFLSGDAKNRPGPFTRPDMILNSGDWNNLVVGKLSPFIDVDSPCLNEKKNSEHTLNQELALASHLGIPAVTFKLTGNISENANLARIINDKLSNSLFQVWVQVPMENPAKRALSYRGVENAEVESTWEWWNSFRSLCDFDKKLGLTLIVSEDLPEMEEIDRWLSEPVQCLVLPTTLFITNKKGYPVLSKAHQHLVRKFSAFEIQFILTGANRYKNMGHYHHYLNHLWQSCNANGPIETFAKGYEDYLQFPLQPLMDNLQSQTYEIFEKDPYKYTEYQNAIRKALSHIGRREDSQSRTLIVMVVGAGRGPLVQASLNAATLAKKLIKVYAVEKNPNAVITLQALKDEMWGNDVTVVSSDMREWQAPEKADILVSELLGSFGDNELSPECLDGVQRFLKDDGVSIPSSYSSYICPIQSSKLYNEVRQFRDKDKSAIAHFETPYIVHLQNKYVIANPQKLFSFDHPNKDEIIDNSRYEMRKFSVKQNCVLTGFAGYFDAVLFDNIQLSIVPNTHSPGMFSWFPILFPIQRPMHLKAGDELVLHFWRRCNPKKVWYEWCVSQPVPGVIHNLNGRSYTIGL